MPTNAVKAYVKEIISKHDPGKMIIDVGAGEEPNYYEELFRGTIFHKLDIVQNKAKTITHVYDLYIPQPNLIGHYTTVLLLEVLEHVPFPITAARGAAKFLKPGGLMILSSPTVWGEHKHPKDYWRFLPDGFELILKETNLQILDIRLQQKDTITPGAIFAAAVKP